MEAVIKDMLTHGVHIGYKRQFWSPRMRDYLFGTQNSVYVFDLSKTLACLDEARQVLKSYTEKGKTVLLVGTKLQAKDLVRTFAEDVGIPYIDRTWVPGFLTNFTTLKRRIATYNKLREDLGNETLSGFTKKERAEKQKELTKLDDAYRGVRDMKRVPDILLVIDGRYERLALSEAKRLGIPSVALLGSNGNTDMVTHVIPCNVNLTKSIAYILDAIKDSVRRPKKDPANVETGNIRKIVNRSPRRPEGTPETPAPATPEALS